MESVACLFSGSSSSSPQLREERSLKRRLLDRLRTEVAWARNEVEYYRKCVEDAKKLVARGRLQQELTSTYYDKRYEGSSIEAHDRCGLGSKTSALCSPVETGEGGVHDGGGRERQDVGHRSPLA